MSFIGFGKSPAGNDALQIGGHDLPITAVAAVGTIAAVLLVLHARSKGASVIAVGPTPTAAAATPGASTTGFSADAGTLTNLSDEITALANGLGNLQSQVAASAIAPPPVIPVVPPPQPVPAPIDPNTALVNSDYQSILNRSSDPSGLPWALGVLSGPGGDAALVSALSHSTEAAGIAVNADYLALLGRPADPSGLSNYEAMFQAQGNDAVQANIKQSAEYAHMTHPAALPAPTMAAIVR